MTESEIIGIAAFVAIFGGVAVGLLLAPRLPLSHTSAETRASVSLAMAVVGTMSALVIGFLISTANNAFIARANAIADLGVDMVRLDNLLDQYGPSTAQIRGSIRLYAREKVRELDRASRPAAPAISNLAVLNAIAASIAQLHPNDDHQREVLEDIERVVDGIQDARWLLIEKGDAAVPLSVLALLIFWLAILFASFGLFAPRNATAVTALLLCSLAVSGGIFMIMDLGTPTRGFMRPTLEPLEMAVQRLGVG